MTEITCNIDELLPTDWLLKDLKKHSLSKSISKELEQGGVIKRALDVSALSDYPEGFQHVVRKSFARMGFDTSKSKYLIHVGHHRWAAAMLNNVPEMKIVVRPKDKIEPSVQFRIAQMMRDHLGSK